MTLYRKMVYTADEGRMLHTSVQNKIVSVGVLYEYAVAENGYIGLTKLNPAKEVR